MEYQIGALHNPGGTSGSIVQTEHFDYKVIQKAVGGRFERAFLSKELDEMNIDAYVNEEGKLNNLKPSAVVYDKTMPDSEEAILDVIAGPILFIGHDGNGGSVGLSDEQKKWIQSNLIEFVQAINNDDPSDVLSLMIFRR